MVDFENFKFLNIFGMLQVLWEYVKDPQTLGVCRACTTGSTGPVHIVGKSQPLRLLLRIDHMVLITPHLIFSGLFSLWWSRGDSRQKLGRVARIVLD